ncbi:NAD(P)H-dependent oxidoreductase [Stenotrophomonas humi]
MHGSYRRQLTHTFIEHWLSLQPYAKVRNRDIGQQPPAHVNHRWSETALGPEPDSDWASNALTQSDEPIDELLWAEFLVLGVPMYSFGIPSSLKAWIDQTVRLGGLPPDGNPVSLQRPTGSADAATSGRPRPCSTHRG